MKFKKSRILANNFEMKNINYTKSSLRSARNLEVSSAELMQDISVIYIYDNSFIESIGPLIFENINCPNCEGGALLV